MTPEEFNTVLDDTFKRVNQVLRSKATEYATEDRLHNFKRSAGMRGCTPIQALSGMLIKHTTSIYDMMESGKSYSPEQWDEKIIDHINYLILLRALEIEANG